MLKLKVGQKAPDFNLPDQNGKLHKLSDYKGKGVLLYFYPKDDTPGCTKEACGIRNSYSRFKKQKLVVLGVSVDSVKKHAKFAKKYKLPFTLLADEEKKVVNLYGVWAKKKYTLRPRSGRVGREYMGTLRTSFLIDSKGRIVKIYETVKPEFHAKEVLIDLKSQKYSKVF
ncbi:MAG: thioredoxin-dependent thiol peroxidase [Parcubacteria group bacterium]|nr:thioredoxin-dependent thiol peroxidase [Parcubacteria group bacterium]